MSRTDPQVNFRLPQELRDKLSAASKASGRTLTAEIVSRLEDSFAERRVFTADSSVDPGRLTPTSGQEAVARQHLADMEALAENAASRALENFHGRHLAALDYILRTMSPEERASRPSTLDHAMRTILGASDKAKGGRDPGESRTPENLRLKRAPRPGKKQP